MTSNVGSRVRGSIAIALDGAGGGAHAVAHDAPLEPRPGRASADEQELAVADDDLRVRADVHQQRHPLARVHPGDEDPGERVAADVAADVGQHDDRRGGVHAEPQLRGAHNGEAVRDRYVRRPAEMVGVEAEEEVRHRGVAGHADAADLPGRDARGDGELRSEVVDGPRRKLLQPFETALVQAQVRAGEDVLAVRHLRVQHGALPERSAGVEIDQRPDDVRRTQIDGEPEVPRTARPPARCAAASARERGRPSRPRENPAARSSFGRPATTGRGAWTPLSPRASSPPRTRSRSAAWSAPVGCGRSSRILLTTRPSADGSMAR